LVEWSRERGKKCIDGVCVRWIPLEILSIANGAVPTVRNHNEIKVRVSSCSK
jgi:hypothetical protein